MSTHGEKVFYLTLPTDLQVEEFRSRAAATRFSYSAVGATSTGSLPQKYVVDRNRVELGFGRQTFDRAIAAIQHWEMFDLGWVKALSSQPAEKDLVVVVRSAHLGFWSLNACRVVYTVDDRLGTAGSGSVSRQSEARKDFLSFGFAYGTLMDHAESGEERFLVEWNQSTDVVSYDILAFSRPANPLVTLGYPFARKLQRRFAKDSKIRMLRAVSLS